MNEHLACLTGDRQAVKPEESEHDAATLHGSMVLEDHDGAVAGTGISRSDIRQMVLALAAATVFTTIQYVWTAQRAIAIGSLGLALGWILGLLGTRRGRTTVTAYLAIAILLIVIVALSAPEDAEIESLERQLQAHRAELEAAQARVADLEEMVEDQSGVEETAGASQDESPSSPADSDPEGLSPQSSSTTILDLMDCCMNLPNNCGNWRSGTVNIAGEKYANARLWDYGYMCTEGLLEHMATVALARSDNIDTVRLVAGIPTDAGVARDLAVTVTVVVDDQEVVSEQVTVLSPATMDIAVAGAVRVEVHMSFPTRDLTFAIGAIAGSRGA